MDQQLLSSLAEFVRTPISQLFRPGELQSVTFAITQVANRTVPGTPSNAAVTLTLTACGEEFQFFLEEEGVTESQNSARCDCDQTCRTGLQKAGSAGVSGASDRRTLPNGDLQLV